MVEDSTRNLDTMVSNREDGADNYKLPRHNDVCSYHKHGKYATITHNLGFRRFEDEGKKGALVPCLEQAQIRKFFQKLDLREPSKFR